MYSGNTAELSGKLEEAKVGCVVGSTFCGLAGYADDFNIICNLKTDLLRAIDISIEYFSSKGVKLNFEKRNFIHLTRNGVIKDVLQVSEYVLCSSQKCDYLETRGTCIKRTRR